MENSSLLVVVGDSKMRVLKHPISGGSTVSPQDSTKQYTGFTWNLFDFYLQLS